MDAASDNGPMITLIAPVYNEIENLEPLHARVVEVLKPFESWELILVDDGSTDGSTELIAKLGERDPRVRGVIFPENRGQTAAIAAGFGAVRGPLVATMDADMQNDPVDLIAMHEALGEHDSIVGYRVKRNDNFVRRMSSKIANGIRNRLSQDDIRDTGCSLKIFRTEAIRTIPMFTGMHRFLPTLLRMHGFSVIEHPVSHHPRTRGESKYGVWNRALPVLRDLFAVRWMRSRVIAPFPHPRRADRS